MVKGFDLLSKPTKEFLTRERDKWTVEGMAVSARDHIGRTIDRSQIMELVLDTGCAYFGARAAANIRAKFSETATPEDLFAGIVIGLLGRRLATALGGTPPVSQIAGLSILGSIGLIDISADIAGNLDNIGFGFGALQSELAHDWDLVKKLSGTIKSKL